ncbi:amino acid permease-domain-containing protein [Hyaloraphidium curvatum]|nr:amino acid permease-domain-containing protein [Hyaloraphidium curvatum]
MFESQGFLRKLFGLAEKEIPIEDRMVLANLGYKQETDRPFNRITTFALNYVNVCVLLNVPLMNYALTTGGPATVMWSFLPVSLLVGCVALSMAELCSAFPSMGGLYLFAYKLGGEKWGPFAAWNTAWMNYFANVAGLANACQGSAYLVLLMWEINSEWSPEIQEFRNVEYGFYVLFLVLVACINIFGEHWLPMISQWTSYFVMIGTIIIAIWPLCTAPTLQSGSFVFLEFQNYTGWDSNVLVALIGLLPAAWNIVGFDASSHIAEETTASSTSASWSLVWTCVFGFVGGFFLWCCQFFIVQDLEATLNSDYDAFVQMWLDTVGLGPTTAFLAIMMISFLMTSCASVVVTSRMFFSLVRDKALPYSGFWYHINPRFKSPVRAILLTTFITLVLGMFTLFSDLVFPAMTSISTACFFVSCVIPTFFRITVARNTFVPGPFNLGRYTFASGWIAVIFVAFLFVIFMLPTEMPIASDLSNFNFAPLVMAAFLIGVELFWLLWARTRYKGPLKTVSDEEIKQLEAEMRALGGEVDSEAASEGAEVAKETAKLQDAAVKV